MKALVIRPGAISLETIDLPDDDQRHYLLIKKIIGGWLCSAFSFKTDDGLVHGYCDDEFLINGRSDWSCAIGDSLRTDAPYPIGGPLIIAGATQEGENRTLTESELSIFTLGEKIKINPRLDIPAPPLPLLQWEG